MEKRRTARRRAFRAISRQHFQDEPLGEAEEAMHNLWNAYGKAMYREARINALLGMVELLLEEMAGLDMGDRAEAAMGALLERLEECGELCAAHRREYHLEVLNHIRALRKG